MFFMYKFERSQPCVVYGLIFNLRSISNMNMERKWKSPYYLLSYVIQEISVRRPHVVEKFYLNRLNLLIYVW